MRMFSSISSRYLRLASSLSLRLASSKILCSSMIRKTSASSASAAAAASFAFLFFSVREASLAFFLAAFSRFASSMACSSLRFYFSAFFRFEISFSSSLLMPKSSSSLILGALIFEAASTERNISSSLSPSKVWIASTGPWCTASPKLPLTLRIFLFGDSLSETPTLLRV